eukprot:Em0013g64a
MVFHLLLVSLKGYVQVGVAIISLKTTKHTGVVHRVGSSNIDDLEVHLECSASFVSSQFYPYLTSWYNTIVPAQQP